VNAQLKQKQGKYKFQCSILIPMLNEQDTILFILNKVKVALAKFNYEIIVVDDGSTDFSKDRVDTFINLNPQLNIQYIYQNNLGKGGAIRSAIAASQGEILVVQDADLEYDPNDIPALLNLFNKHTQVVYGSRILMKSNTNYSSLFFYWGGHLVTFTTNFLFKAQLTDEATGYKLFHSELLKNTPFKNNDFAWEPEITAKILKKKIAIIEHPICYQPRTKLQGKKITWRDGIKALSVLCIEYLKK
jgi:dolichol-phosphate mannosyltransferase